MSAFSIPKLSPAELRIRAARIKPVGKKGNQLFFFPDDDLVNAFKWHGLTSKRAEGLEPLKTIRTLHTYGFYGFFKPSITEVLSQLPVEDLEVTVAFEVNGPESASDLNKHLDELDAGFHVAETTLYRRVK